MLNALRHQRFDHSLFGQAPVHDPTHLVLNALRHQRFDHLASPPEIVGKAIDVLNALRHQRFDHYRITSVDYLKAECSTPYGIRGLITRIREARADSSLACSTPYGIRGLIT